MIRYLILIFYFILTAWPCQARDFMVEFVEENYMESQDDDARNPMVYHSLQVRSHSGLKMLVLTGEHPEYRKWLRQYIARDKCFIVKVADNENDTFISSTVFQTDVINVHPFNPQKWTMTGSRMFSEREISQDPAPVIPSSRNILVLDQNTIRSHLIDTVIQRMGYTGTISSDPETALSAFINQPDKFRMVIVNYNIPGMGSEAFIDKLLKLDHKIPILVETGYNNKKRMEKYQSRFSKADTVTVTPVALDRLSQTIHTLARPEKENTFQNAKG